MRTDVLIVGAGPTGLALACQLARFGIDHIIIDEKETTTPFSKAIGVQARTLEIYEQIGLAEKLIEPGWKTNGVQLVEDGKVRGQINLTDFGKGLSPYPFLLIIEQGKHEDILYEYLRSNGKDVLWNTKLESFIQNDSGVKAELRNASGEPQTIDAKYLVGCDGAHSIIRHGLNIDFSGSTFERLFYVADVNIDWQFSNDWLYVNLGEDTLTAFFPMAGEKRWRIVGTFPENSDKKEGDILYEEIERQVKEDTHLDFDITEVNWFSVYKVHSRAVDRFSKGRCFLAGDSAHIHTPVGAQGMNTGIQDGYNLAWKLAAVLNDGFHTDLLESYNEERLPNAKSLINTTDRMFDLAAGEEWYLTFFRMHILPRIAHFITDIDAFRKFIFPLISQIGISYSESSLSIKDGHFKIKAGDRMPWFKVDGMGIYDRLREPKFHVIYFSDEKIELENISAADVHSIKLSDETAEIFGTNEPFTVVLRPDNYIGYIGNGISPENAAKYLNNISHFEE